MSFILPIGDSLKHQNFKRSLLTVKGFSLKGPVFLRSIKSKLNLFCNVNFFLRKRTIITAKVVCRLAN